MNKVCQWKKDFLLLVLNAKCIHLWMKSYGVTIDYFKSWKLLSATFLFSVYYAVQGGSNSPVFGRNPIVRTFKWKLLSGTFVFFYSVLIEKLGGRWLCHDELQLIFSRLLVFTETTQVDGTYGDPLVNAHRSPNDSVLKTTPETICEYLSFVILSKAMFTLYWKAFSGATTGGYLQ